MKKIAVIFGLLVALLMTGCESNEPSNNNQEQEFTPVASIGKDNRVIYQVNLRSFSQEGTLAALQNDLDRLQTLGVDILWLMPIHPVGQQDKVGALGSPYAPRDYKAIDPAYGTEQDLKNLVHAAHSKGMAVWLDWVANHTAKDCAWVTEHLEYYGKKGKLHPYSPTGYGDVYQLDHGNAGLQAAMKDALCYWVREFDIDGYRCDFATNIPVSFWKQMREAVNQIKEVEWLCEGDNKTYMQVFDMDYAWGFNDFLNEWVASANVSDLRATCLSFYNNEFYTNKARMLYLTNHDLSAYHGTEFGRYGNAVYPLTVLEFTLSDLPLIYNGQEIGFNQQIDFTSNSKVNWRYKNAKMSNLIHQMTRLKRTVPALASGPNRGTLYNVATSDPNVYAFVRTKGESSAVVVLNFGTQSTEVQLQSGVPDGDYIDFLTGQSVDISEVSTVTLTANGYAVFVK